MTTPRSSLAAVDFGVDSSAWGVPKRRFRTAAKSTVRRSGSEKVFTGHRRMKGSNRHLHLVSELPGVPESNGRSGRSSSTTTRVEAHSARRRRRARRALRRYGRLQGLRVAYARFSTDGQAVTAQRNSLLALGLPGNGSTSTHGLTGAHRDRLGLREALAACRARDMPVVTKLDRPARSSRSKRPSVAEAIRWGEPPSLTERPSSTHQPSRLARRCSPDPTFRCPGSAVRLGRGEQRPRKGSASRWCL